MNQRLPYTLLAIIIFAPCLKAWNDVGHMSVAYVAYQKLTPAARARVDHLLMLNPYYEMHWKAMIPASTPEAQRGVIIFMFAATWPDAIKRDDTYQDDGPDKGDRPPSDGTASRNTGYTDTARHKYWHFIDLPFTTDHSPLPTPPDPNIQTQITAFRAVLASDDSDDLKSYDLTWLMHLVGDVHQPLHCATRVTKKHPDGDAGGNFVGFCAANAPKCTSKLHTFWDDVLGTDRSPAAVMKLAAGLKAPAITDAGDVQNWIGESWNLSRKKVYAKPVGNDDGPYRATKAYTDAARKLASQRVALAGARLAAILNQELK
ncbi:MAG TPA: S1/P1 nuclease [Bryobacteraceae bacterium]|nr:S1/P1 nuclease [Bryobacteraceae bacterium]